MAVSPRTTATSPALSLEDVVQAIIQLMQDHGLKPGDRLPAIRELAATLAVPPTLVRDALLRAQTVGLVRIVPRGGAFVQSLTYAPLVDALVQTLQPGLMQQDHNLMHLIEARDVLEIQLVGLAARRRRIEDLYPLHSALEAMAGLTEPAQLAAYVEQDVRFHVEIGRIAGNTVLQACHQAIMALTRTFLVQQNWSAERQERTTRAHAAIYDALVAGDEAQAREAMRHHLSASTVLLEVLKSPSLPPKG